MATLFSTDKALSYARKAEKARDWATAYDLLEGVLRRFPKNRRAKQMLKDMRPTAVQDILQQAQHAQKQHQWSIYENHLSLAFKFAPNLPDVGVALTGARIRLGDATGAFEAAGDVLTLSPDNAEAKKLKAQALLDMGQVVAARDAYAACLSGTAEDAEILVQLGQLARAAGDKDAERDYAEQACALMPENGEAHWALARTKSYTAEDPHLAEMEALIAGTGVVEKSKTALHLALFKAYDDCGTPKQAFAHLQRSNQLMRDGTPFDFKVEMVRLALSKTLIKVPLAAPSGPPKAVDGPRPIFVTGLPRTGTTLTERILAQDPAAKPCGELPVLGHSVSRMLQGLIDGTKKSFTQEDLQALRQTIFVGFAPYIGDSICFIDKMPLNFRWIGFVAAAIPEARFIHMNRDPMAVAWSHYQHAFKGTDNGFVFHMEDIARYMVLHRDWMAHWRAVCPGRILDVDYAALVTDTEAETKRLADFTGLEWSEAWLSPEKNESHAFTASAAQIRKPIYSGSDEAWRKYETQLEPLVRALKTVDLI